MICPSLDEVFFNSIFLQMNKRIGLAVMLLMAMSFAFGQKGERPSSWRKYAENNF